MSDTATPVHVLIHALAAATQQVRRDQANLDRARESRRALIRRAAREGMTYRDIAAASGVAYEQMAIIVTGSKPPTRRTHDHLEHACPRCGAKAGVPCEDKAPWQAHIERHHLAIEQFGREHPELG